MKQIQRFLNLFHRRQQVELGQQSRVLLKLKKLYTFGTFGFMIALVISKQIQSNLIFACQPTTFNKRVIQLSQTLEKGVYQPSMMMIFGILQRIYGRYFEDKPYIRLEEQKLGQQVLKWVPLHDKIDPINIKSIPIAVVVSGSDGFDNTMIELMLSMYKLGYKTVGIHPSDFHNCQKMATILNGIQQKHPGQKIYGLGIQYGANLIINLAANHTKLFSALISVGNPYDLTKSQLQLERSWLWKFLYRDIRNQRIQNHQSQHKNISILKKTTLYQLDQYLYNIDPNQVQDWKQAHSSINNISKLQCHCLFLQSLEDPFTIPVQNDIRFENQLCLYVSTKRGGHNEWFQNLKLNRWFVKPIREYLKLINQNHIT